MNDHDRDPLAMVLAGLRQGEPRAAATERVRARCHAMLERQQARREQPPRSAGARLIDATLVFAAGLYLLVAVSAAAMLLR